MKKPYLIGVLILLMSPFFFIRLSFDSQLSDFKLSISDYSDSLRSILNSQKNTALIGLEDSAAIAEAFHAQFSDTSIVQQEDTLFTHFYITESVPYNYYSLMYSPCLIQKCRIDLANKKTNKVIAEKQKEFKRKYGAYFDKWFPNFKDDISENISDTLGCEQFFDLDVLQYKENRWLDFKSFLDHYSKQVKQQESKNKAVVANYERIKSSYRSKINYSSKAKFDAKIKNLEKSILVYVTENYSFTTNYFGSIDYELSKAVLKENVLSKAADQILKEQWKTNSLRTGSMPYANCYGSFNDCYDYSCSQIKVKNSGNDVIVLVKQNNRVKRHAYIKGSSSFTFDVSDGIYSVYFYSGKGWNPYKKMKNTYCGTPTGGFVSAESVTKDDFLNLDGQIMTYTLYPVPNGNFIPKESSVSEAF